MNARGQVRGAVAVMAKAPRQGFVKTRLASAVADVARLSECMLLDTIALVRSLPRVHAAVVCPRGDLGALARLLPRDVTVAEQEGNGLAAGLASAFARFVPAFGRVIALDSDSPHLPARILDSAFALLDTHDVVVGPTEDGGYHLVGASAAHAHLFDPAPLGTRTAREALLANARAKGLSVALAEAWYDVDLPADLRRLAAELRERPERAPRTASLLASLSDGERAG